MLTTPPHEVIFPTTADAAAFAKNSPPGDPRAAAADWTHSSETEYSSRSVFCLFFFFGPTGDKSTSSFNVIFGVCCCSCLESIFSSFDPIGVPAFGSWWCINDSIPLKRLEHAWTDQMFVVGRSILRGLLLTGLVFRAVFRVIITRLVGEYPSLYSFYTGCDVVCVDSRLADTGFLPHRGHEHHVFDAHVTGLL
ncbi:hypothetical protein BC826DRAFT_1008981 [Russula brevipes]|nr:hypothetical protein BC826DRAFT_1008981 [Russula brevipes]